MNELKINDSNEDLRKDKYGVGIGGFGYNLSAAGIQTFLTFFYTEHMLISAASISLILLASRIIDALTDLLVGALMDRTSTKYGKIRPWLLWMMLPGFISISAMFFVPAFNETGRIIYAFITYNCVAFFYLTAVQLPVIAWVSVITSNSSQRLKISQAYGLFNTLGAVISNLFAAKMMGMLGGGAGGFFWYFTIIGATGGICIFICFLMTKERVVRNTYEKVPIKLGLKCIMKNKYCWNILFVEVALFFLIASLSSVPYYCLYILNGKVSPGPLMSLIWGGMAVGVILFTPIQRKVGKIKSCIYGYSFQALGSVIMLFAPSSVTVIWIATAVRALGSGAFAGTMNAIRAECVDYGEWKTGIRTEGLVYSGTTFGTKVGSALGGAAVAALLAWGGYVANAAVQTASALLAIKISFIICPLIADILIVICFCFYDLEKKIPQIRKELNERAGKE